MNGQFHNCEKCSGYLVLAYDGWSCNQCGRKYFVRNGRTEEMWWKNEKVNSNGIAVSG